VIQHSRPGLSQFGWAYGIAIGIAILGILAAHSIDTPSMGGQGSDTSAFNGLPFGQSPSGIQTNFSLEEIVHEQDNGFFRRAAWQVTNQDQQQLTINRVVINGEHTLPGATAYGEAIFRDQNLTMPVSLSVGQSQLFFEANDPDDSLSYRKNVIFVDVYTDRGNFRYKDGVFGELPSGAEANLPAAEAQYDQWAAKAWNEWRATNIAQTTALVHAFFNPGPAPVSPGTAPGADPVTGRAPPDSLDTSKLPRQ